MSLLSILGLVFLCIIAIFIPRTILVVVFGMWLYAMAGWTIIIAVVLGIVALFIDGFLFWYDLIHDR